MKRCPTCNRVETDETLKFCRVDGATLFRDSSSIETEAGTVQFGSSSASEIETSVLAHRTDVNINRATVPTTVLVSPQAAGNTSELSKPKRRRTTVIVAVIVTAFVAALTAILVGLYRSRTSSAAAIQS